MNIEPTRPDRGRFMVEWYVPSRDLVSLETDVARLVASGAGLRHLLTILMTADETCLVLVEAPSAEAVADAGRSAGMDVDRIVEVGLIT